MAMEAQGGIFYWSTSTVTAYTDAVGEITSYNGPGGACAIIDITHLQSTAKSKMIGLRDEGQISFDMNYVATDAGQNSLIYARAAREKRHWAIAFGDASSHIAWGKGYCMNYNITGAVDNKITANAVVEITGPVVYTTK